MAKPKRLYKGDKVAVVCMPHALMGSEFIAQHPELKKTVRNLKECWYGSYF